MLSTKKCSYSQGRKCFRKALAPVKKPELLEEVFVRPLCHTSVATNELHYFLRAYHEGLKRGPLKPVDIGNIKQ